ncbi:uncharacterized protein LOC126748333 isoform X2 [Anthonomus grandis grandis]|uniref:uncharacterized protein LOC126748333 isoform X2 n=1 Tax=Anthonomus grandis grandis TaxID=2921223 RepID=UPI0021656339|nr:uncharacterized protein LOC126748333 isoform X2 [Anthonomus grandis grandis]
MGNIRSQQVSSSNDHRFESSQFNKSSMEVITKPEPQLKVISDLKSRQRLRQTNNGNILQSGGTLSGRHHQVRQSSSEMNLKNQNFLCQESDIGYLEKRDFSSSHNVYNFSIKSYKSEPDLHSSLVQSKLKEKKLKKKYKAPSPPCEKNHEKYILRNNDVASDDYQPRRARLYKTRMETKLESNQVIASQSDGNAILAEEKIIRQQCSNNLPTNRLSLPNFDTNILTDLKNELQQVTEQFKQIKGRLMDQNQNIIIEDNFNTLNINEINSSSKEYTDLDQQITRSDPSGKECSTLELSLLPATENQKPKAFYFGMTRDDFEICKDEVDEYTPEIDLCLRPVLPRKPPQIPNFSPSVAWRLLDAPSQDSGISGDAQPPLSTSWTPQQDLGDDSSLEEMRRDDCKEIFKQRPHVFSLSLPRDSHSAAACLNKAGLRSIRKIKRSVSGVFNTLSLRKDTEQRLISKDVDNDNNWFLSRSAPNSLNENSPDILEFPLFHVSPNSRLMYLPEKEKEDDFVESRTFSMSAFSKSCEELKMPESLRDLNLEGTLNKEERLSKPKKFTFQSTMRQIERKRIADKLSKEAEKKERQRLKELNIMRCVEEEFQKKRAKEKANIRYQLRLYSKDQNESTSLPFEFNSLKIEERQEPDGAFSSTASSPILVTKYEKIDSKVNKKKTQVTQELSEYRQMQRDYKDYRGTTKYGPDNRALKQTTVYPEVTCNMPRITDASEERENYRKKKVIRPRSSRSIESVYSEDSIKVYRNTFSPMTKF